MEDEDESDTLSEHSSYSHSGSVASRATSFAPGVKMGGGKGKSLRRGKKKRKSKARKAKGAGEDGTLSEQLDQQLLNVRLMTRQIDEQQKQLTSRERVLGERDKRIALLQQQLSDEKEKNAALMQVNASRLVQISQMERSLESEANKQKLMLDDLSLQTRMMDALLGFRAREYSREMVELLHDKIDAQEKASKWKERARFLEHERGGFVQRWRTERRAARDAGVRLVNDDDDGDLDAAEAAATPATPESGTPSPTTPHKPGAREILPLAPREAAPGDAPAGADDLATRRSRGVAADTER